MIYVIDDDRGWEAYYRRVLKGYELEFFHDGISAVAEMDAVVPDLVILDILLSGPTGFAVLNEMRSYPALADVSVIVISNVGLDDDEALASYGVVRSLDKAMMTPRDMLATVSEYVGGKNA